MADEKVSGEKLQHNNAQTAEMYTVSALEKVFPYEKPTLAISQASILKNERFHFQVVVKSDEHVMDGCLKIESALQDYIRIYSVDYVAVTSEISRWPAYDDYRIHNKQEMGIYPDVLRPFDAYKHVFKKNIYTPFWISVETEGSVPAGKYPIVIKAYDDKGVCLGETQLELEILSAALSEEKPFILDWLHYDSICLEYRTRFLSKRFYKILGEYLKKAVKNGMNILFTPALSVAVDTDVNTYRQDVQLLKITEGESGYSFDFSDLDKFIEFARGYGIQHFCFSHIASQWGAKSAVRIRVEKNGKKCYKFGWGVSSADEVYLGFLKDYLKALDSYLTEKGIKQNCFINISDETLPADSENYIRLSKLIRETTKSLKILDTTGDDFYIENKYMDIPVVSSDKYGEIKNKAGCWVYYCCAQRSAYLSNRFINMPSQRNRILGMQMYLNDTRGFLHWGYNFYAGYLSRKFANAYAVNDGMGMFEAGDCFMVYPTKEGCIDSLRQPVFYDGLQDYMALKTLEKYIGRESVVELLKKEGMEGFSTYPRSAEWHIVFREKINRMIAAEANGSI